MRFASNGTSQTVGTEEGLDLLRKLGFDPLPDDDPRWAVPTPHMLHAEGDTLSAPDLLARASIAGHIPQWFITVVHRGCEIEAREVTFSTH